MSRAERRAVPATTALLQATALTVYRGEEPLFADIDLTLCAGEAVQIEGSNGSGKTTLLRILCGLALADEGEVYWRGRTLRSQRAEFNAETIYLGHKAGIKAQLSPIENLRHYQRLGANSDTDILQLLDRVHLSARADIPCAVLSAGQQRRVALARLLLSPARLWILDEPLTSLDAEGRDTVQQLLAQHVAGGGSLLYTTHQALPIADMNLRSLRLGEQLGSVVR